MAAVVNSAMRQPDRFSAIKAKTAMVTGQGVVTSTASIESSMKLMKRTIPSNKPSPALVI